MTKINWDITTWDTPTLLKWINAIGERSDRVISDARIADDWSDYETDRRMYVLLTHELKARGLDANGEAITR